MLIDGKKVAGEIQLEIKEKISSLHTRKPGLAFILVGDNPASQSYVRSKKKACQDVGIFSKVIELPKMIAESDLLKQIEHLNKDPSIDGILVQLPLPSHINEQTVVAFIDPTKDVDGFHPINVGKMFIGDESGFLPCTPLGIKVLLEKAQIPVEKKHVVIVGRSNIVGKPLGAILIQKKPHCNATVTIAHSQSENLAEITRSADILVSAVGKPLFIKKEMIKEGSSVIDVGINRLPDGSLVGDVDFTTVSKKAANITPVPGGVGPMTIAMLLQNTLLSFLKVCLFLFLITSCQKKEPCTYLEGFSMMMPYRITIGNPISKSEIQKVRQIVEQTFEEVHAVFDHQNPHSEISRLNASSKEMLIPLSAPLQDLLLLCQKVVLLSGGRFDPTVGPLIELWRKSKHPAVKEQQSICEALGWNHISIQNGIFKKDQDATKLDFQSISKGICIDWMIERLQKIGITDMVVEWAGKVRAIGHHPDNKDWTIEIDPSLTINKKSIAPIPLRNCAIAIRNNPSHIIDPLTAAPLEKTNCSITSVNVIAPTCALADALATAAMVFHNRKEAESFASEVVELYSNVSFWILSHRGD
jgi:methylenetetrahydrofolate dehydrogenase (NADP+)/methenyltetrahydrofolate cyclohydrolase